MVKPVSILLSFLLLISSVGFSVNTHTCFGNVVDQGIALGISNLDCGMGDDDQCGSATSNNEQNIESSSCCKNESLRVELDTSFEVSDVISPQSLEFVFSFFVNHFLLSQEFVGTHQSYSPDRPPLPKQSICILFQSFLI